MVRKTVAWSWTREMRPEGGRWVVTISGGPKFTARKVSPEEVEDFAENLADASEIFSALHQAKQAFASGAADYLGARERLRALVVEYRRAEEDLARAAMDVGTLFEPDGIVKQFEGQASALQTFIRDAIEKLSARAAPEPPAPAEVVPSEREA